MITPPSSSARPRMFGNTTIGTKTQNSEVIIVNKQAKANNRAHIHIHLSLPTPLSFTHIQRHVSRQQNITLVKDMLHMCAQWIKKVIWYLSAIPLILPHYSPAARKLSMYLQQFYCPTKICTCQRFWTNNIIISRAWIIRTCEQERSLCNTVMVH